MSYVLAVDGGGTKTKIVCADDQGTVVGEGLSGPTNLTATSLGAASFNLKEAIRQATQDLPEGWSALKMVMGVAGIDSPAEEQVARDVFSQVLQYYQIAELELVNDTVIALASGSEREDALVLVAGTGSNCYGTNSRSEEARAGGMDFLISDEGSGYAIGREVLRAAIRSYDGRSAKTALEQLVLQQFGLSSMADIKQAVYNPTLGKAEVAELATLCIKAQDQGDEIAGGILEAAVAELITMVQAVATKLALVESGFDCVLVGGVTTVPYVSDLLRQQLTQLYPSIQIVVPTREPVYGALSLALK